MDPKFCGKDNMADGHLLARSTFQACGYTLATPLMLDIKSISASSAWVSALNFLLDYLRCHWRREETE